MKTEYYLGVMSGSSLDAIDCALVEFSSTNQIKLIYQHSIKIPLATKHTLLSLTQPQHNEIDIMAQMDVTMGELIAECCLTTLSVADIKACDINAIGSHGQTIRHYPQGNYKTSLQIGDPNIIVSRTGIKTIADFRRRDMAVGGQGAPLVPPFHQLLFQNYNAPQIIVNIGGISNISCLITDSRVLGYDTGPGNCLMDLWSQENFNQDYDIEGKIAASGSILDELLKHFLTDPYFSQIHPKSTGREYFSDFWLKDKIHSYINSTPNISLETRDVMTTLNELTAQSISREINKADFSCKRLIVCGGGAKNDYLLSRLKKLSPSIEVKSSDHLGVPSESIECMAFAWLARQNCHSLTSNLPSVTGARKTVILGSSYQKC